MITNINLSAGFHKLVRLGEKGFMLATSGWRARLISIGVLVLAVVAYQVSIYLFAPIPTITLSTSEDILAISGETLFLKGVVSPPNAKVIVNDQPVARNGDGGFTIILKVPKGDSTVAINAFYKGKKAQVVQLVNRKLTPQEEEQAKKDAELKEIAARQTVLGVDEKINEGIEANRGTEVGAVKIFSHELKEESGFKRIVGEVLNTTLDDAYAIEITADLYDSSNNSVGTKRGLAQLPNNVLKPGETAKFQTLSITQKFDYYRLSVDWKTDSVVGVDKEPADAPDPTPTRATESE